MERGKTEPTWHTPWETWGKQLFNGLTRPESTIATILRTEVIGLNAFLAKIGVPNARPACPCGAARQTRSMYSSPNVPNTHAAHFASGTKQLPSDCDSISLRCGMLMMLASGGPPQSRVTVRSTTCQPSMHTTNTRPKCSKYSCCTFVVWNDEMFDFRIAILSCMLDPVTPNRLGV